MIDVDWQFILDHSRLTLYLIVAHVFFLQMTRDRTKPRWFEFGIFMWSCANILARIGLTLKLAELSQLSLNYFVPVALIIIIISGYRRILFLSKRMG
jgi:hypothetical protein